MTEDFPHGAAMIFGGSGGIGGTVAACFAAAGSDIAICYRSNVDRAEAAAEACAAHGVKVSLHHIDVRARPAVDGAIADGAAAHGRIHTVVWSAGPLVPQVRIADWTDAQIRDAMEIELLGFANAARAAIPHMRTAGGGSFVHLGSAGHHYWPKGDGLSVATKAANEALIKGIAKEEGRHGIRANSVLIGVIEAGMFHELTAMGHIDERWMAATMNMLCLKHIGQPEDIGNAAVFFASGRARYVTGQTISVSGGLGV